MFVAGSRPTSPVTGGNWEGVGVTPDVSIAEAVSLETAHVLALEMLLRQEPDPAVRSEMENALAAARQHLEEVGARRQVGTP